MKSVRFNQSGFSLIELMIVVAIIGILATIAVPNFQKFQAKAKQTEAKNALGGMFTAEKTFFAEWSQYVADFRALGYCPEGKLQYRQGFTAAGNAGPANWPANQAGLTVSFTSAQFNTIGNTTTGCTYTESPNAGGMGTLAAGSTTAAAAFQAEANGDIDSDTTIDVWTIDEAKTLTNVTSDI